MSQREQDLERLSQLRRSQVAAVEEASRGQLEDLMRLGNGDDRGDTYVVKILDVTPGVGKVAGRRLLARLGISEFARIRELSESERLQVLAGCRELE